MSNAIFPTLIGLGWNVVRTPEWSTRRRRSVSGKEIRIRNWSYPIWHWELTYDYLPSAAATPDYQTLTAFFNSRSGGFDSFLYQDADDNAVTDQPLGTGDGVEDTFQFVRTMTGTGVSFVEPITSINVVTNVKIDSVVVDPADYTVDQDTGQIVFDTPPGDTLPITSTFSYYFRSAFDDDKLTLEKFMHQIWMGRKVAFSSLKA